jgi:DNA phosphorothioation-dependent restriction protein DptG
VIQNWYLETVTSIFSKESTEEIEQQYDELFPHLHTVCACGYFTIAASVLDGALTDEQKTFLQARKEAGELLDYYARNQVHWAQMRPGMPVRPIMCSCGKRIT